MINNIDLVITKLSLIINSVILTLPLSLGYACMQGYVRFNQATGMTKISRGGIFENFSARGGILPEVSNFDRKSRFLALLSHN